MVKLVLGGSKREFMAVCVQATKPVGNSIGSCPPGQHEAVDSGSLIG